MPVRRRLDLKGNAIAFVTTSVLNWEPIFKNTALAKIILQELKTTLELYNASLIAYVLMPSHFHGLIGFKEIKKLSDFMQCFKSMSSRRVKDFLNHQDKEKFYKNGSFHLWRPRFDDLIIESEEQYNVKINYIHNNPVKAGIAENIEDYVFSSASNWLNGSSGLFEIDKSFSVFD